MINVDWAHPTGSRRILLQAAIGEDEQLGLKLFHGWLARNDLDDITFAEQRLLLPIVARYGNALKGLNEYPRLMGMQRLIWTRAQLSFRHNLPSLIKLQSVGIDYVLIKGAAMIALPYVSLKERVSHDMDIVVESERFGDAIKILRDDGWQASTGQSYQLLGASAHPQRAVNLFNGLFGDLDVHSQPFHTGQGDSADDFDFWEQTVRRDLHGVSSKTPSPENMIVLAIAHGGFDGHAHSDWMVDCARVIKSEDIDWALLLGKIIRRSAVLPAAVVFSFFNNVLNIKVNAAFYNQLLKATQETDAPRYYTDLIQVRPKQDFGRLGPLVRFFAKNVRKRRIKAIMQSAGYMKTTVLKSSAKRTTTQAQPKRRSRRHIIDTPQRGHPVSFKVSLLAEPARVARRVHFEINTENAHIASFAVRTLWGSRSHVRILVEGEITVPINGEECFIEARPSKQLRPNEQIEARFRYDALKFEIETIKIGI